MSDGTWRALSRIARPRRRGSSIIKTFAYSCRAYSRAAATPANLRRSGRRFFIRCVFIALILARRGDVSGALGVTASARSGEPEPVPRGLVEQLTENAEADSVVRPSTTLKVGDSIRVTAGPFAELLGTLERLDDSDRVRVLLDILGGRIPVLLPGAVVMPTEAP